SALGHATERADQIHLYGQIENVEREVLDLAGLLRAARRLHGRANASTAHQNALLPVGLARGGEARIDAIVAGDVHLAERGAEFLGCRLAALLVAIEDRHLHALGPQLLNRGPA